MYNPDHKTRFISTIHSLNARLIAEVIFEKTEVAETSIGKDLYLFSQDELSTLINDVLPPRKAGQTAYVKVLNDYFEWSESVISSKLPERNLLVFDETNSRFKQTMVDGPDGMLTYLNAVFPNAEGNRIDCIYRCYCWLAFIGIPEDYAQKIKISDVDFDYLCVMYQGAALPIYREAYTDFRRAVNLKEFVSYHPLYPDKPTIRARVSGDELLRGIKSVSDTSTLRAVITHKGLDAFKQGKTDKKLSYQRLRLSGLFYETYMLERKGIAPDFTPMAELECIEKGFSKERFANNRWRMAKSYLDDYYRWKLIFWNN